jgi:hypothetical protein
MLHEIFGFLKDQLSQYLKYHDAVQEERVVFREKDKFDLSFTNNAITLLLVNLEEENTLRPDELYVQTRKDGTRVSVNPELRLNLYILFVSRFSDYEESLKYLSYVIKFFQSNRVFTHDAFPGLSDNIDRVIMELVTVPFSDQNEIWSVLKTGYEPSALYKVKMLIFEDEEPEPTTMVSEQVMITRQRNIPQ